MMKYLSKIKLHPLMVIFGLLLYSEGLFKYFLIILIIVLFHEFGHFVFAILFKRNVIRLDILPFGGKLLIDSIISTNIIEDLIICMGGVFFQVILSFIVYIFFKSYRLYNLFIYYNIRILLFNLLPINPLDGYKFFKYIIELVIPFKYSFYVMYLIEILCIFLIFWYKLDLIYNNLLIVLFLVFTNIKDIYNYKYILNRFYIERMNYTFNYKVKSISNINDMYKNKANIINGIHENIYVKLYFDNVKNF